MAVLNTTSPSPSTSAPSARPTKARPSSRTSAARGGANRPAPPRSAIDDGGGVGAVDLLQEDLDPLLLRGGDVLAHVVRAYRQLAMSAVDEDRQLDGAGAPELDQVVHRSAHRASVPDDVVDQDHHLAVDGRDAR